MPNTHNKHPEKLLNHTWKIEISRDSENVDAINTTQLLAGDRIKIVREDGSTRVQLIIWAELEGLIYVLDGTLEEYDQVSGGAIYSRAKINFLDSVGGGNQQRTLELIAARLKAGYNYPPARCSSELRGIAKFLTDQEIEAACREENLIVWRVEDRQQTNKATLGALNKPEPGQGTGSGGSD